MDAGIDTNDRHSGGDDDGFMILIEATSDSESGVMPDEKLLAEMGRFNEELVKAGVMLPGEGLHPSSKGATAQGCSPALHTIPHTRKPPRSARAIARP